MRKRRSFGADGSNHAGDKFIHHRKRLGLNITGLVDIQRILHVRVSVNACEYT